MTIPEFNKVNLPTNGVHADYIDPASFQERYPTLGKIDFSPPVGTNFNNGAEKTAAILKSAGARDNNEAIMPTYLDSEIQRLSAEIKKERAKGKPNTSNIDYLIRQLAYFLLRKAGKADQELTQAETDRLCEDVEKLVKTYNTFWSLAASVGGGALGVIGGLVSLGGNITGLVQVAKGAAKASKTVDHINQVGTVLGTLSQGIGTISRPIDAHYEAKRAKCQADQQATSSRKETATQSGHQNKNAQSAALQALRSLNDTDYAAKKSMTSASAA